MAPPGFADITLRAYFPVQMRENRIRTKDERGTVEFILMAEINTTTEVSASTSWTAAQAEALHDPHLHLLVDEDAVAGTQGVAKVIGRTACPVRTVI